MNTPKRLLFVTLVASAALLPTVNAGPETTLTGPVERYISIDNVCAWPNLTVLPDGTIIVAIFNRPSHGQEAGSIEAWASQDGRFWEKRGVVAPHEPDTNRMHVAAGLAKNGDLVMLSTGFTNLQQPGQSKKLPFRDRLLPPWVCRSSDGGRTWTHTNSFPSPLEGFGPFLVFGDIKAGADGALHASAYAQKAGDPEKEDRAWHFRSDDDGRTWRIISVIGTGHNETALLHLEGKRWLAAARTIGPQQVDLFRSNDDGTTWAGPEHVSEAKQIPADLARLADGRLLLTYGTRVADQRGVLGKLSSDEGKTWSAPIRLADSLSSRECGYPSSIQRPDGKIVTAYYSAGVADHTRYHMGVVIWTPPSSTPTP